MKRQEILEKAIECVTGRRKEDYGRAEDNFSLIARLWTDYCGFGFSAKDVAMMMALLKIARIRTGKGTDDCFVDLAGYAACGGEIFSENACKDDSDSGLSENEIVEIISNLNSMKDDYPYPVYDQAKE